MFGLTGASQLSANMVTFTNFPQPVAETVLTQALNGVVAGVVTGYPAITGYSENALTWLSGGNPWGIRVPSNNIKVITPRGLWDVLRVGGDERSGV